MLIISAKVLDTRHLELSQPIPAVPGESIQISIADNNGEEKMWSEAAKQNFLKAYAPEDSIYDNL